MLTSADIREACVQSLDGVLRDMENLQKRSSHAVEVGSINLRIIHPMGEDRRNTQTAVLGTATLKVKVSNIVEVKELGKSSADMEE